MPSPPNKVKMKAREKNRQVWCSHKAKDGRCRGQAERKGAKQVVFLRYLLSWGKEMLRSSTASPRIVGKCLPLSGKHNRGSCACCQLVV